MITPTNVVTGDTLSSAVCWDVSACGDLLALQRFTQNLPFTCFLDSLLNHLQFIEKPFKVFQGQEFYILDLVLV